MRKVKRMLSDEDFLPVTRLQLDRRIKCDVCEALIVPTSYKRHKKAIHNDNSLEKQWKCNQYQKNLQCKFRLAQHEKSHRSTESDQGRNFSCNQCKHRFADSSHLKRHFEGKHLNIKHTCDVCDKKYTSKNDLRKHVTAKHSASSTEEIAPKEENKLQPGYKCKFCEKYYHHKGDLNRHKRTKHTSSTKNEGF